MGCKNIKENQGERSIISLKTGKIREYFPEIVVATLINECMPSSLPGPLICACSGICFQPYLIKLPCIEPNFQFKFLLLSFFKLLEISPSRSMSYFVVETRVAAEVH